MQVHIVRYVYEALFIFVQDRKQKRRTPKFFFGENKRIGYIPNALNFSEADPIKKSQNREDDLSQLRKIGLEPEILDLKDYFGK